MSLAMKIAVGLSLGVLAGVFAGEQIAFIGVVGRAFVLLLQMAVMPFVAVSLMAGLGGLRPGGARSLIRYAGCSLLVIWGSVLLIVLAAPIAFPAWPAAGYFSATLVEERAAFDFLGSYIPSNPFRSFSDGVVPAVVFFSAAFGMALMASERKAPLLDALLAAQDALRRVTSAVVRLAPYGLFAIAAESAGTMAPDRLAGLQVYVVSYVALSLLITFWVLPALVAAVTPFSYRDVAAAARDTLVTAFVTGSLFIVLPIVDDRARSLLSERGADEESGRQIGVIVPIAFTLAGAGKLLGLLFVLYAGWQSGFPISPSEYPEFAVTGLFSSFAASAVSIPFLLDVLHIPSDMFQLYLIVDSVFGGRFSALTGSMHILVVALIAGAGAAGWVQIRKRRLLLWGVVSVVLTGLTLLSIRVGFERFERPYEGYRAFIDRSFSRPTVSWRDRSEIPQAPLVRGADTLTRLRQRGILRVGYAPDRLPYAFRNERGELVGFDVEMAHALARDLGVAVEFFRVDLQAFAGLLESGALDIVMSGLEITPERLANMSFSMPYQQETLAFVVRDHRRNEFHEFPRIQARELELAVPGRGYYPAKIRELLPLAKVSLLESPRQFFRADEGTFDALVIAAEPGSAWTLIYPEFTVAVPQPVQFRVPVGYATARNDTAMSDFIDAWIELKRSDHTIKQLFRYWFEGKDVVGQQRRWSLMEDVLGWRRGGEAQEAAPDASALPSKPPARATPPPAPAPTPTPATPAPAPAVPDPTAPVPSATAPIEPVPAETPPRVFLSPPQRVVDPMGADLPEETTPESEDGEVDATAEEIPSEAQSDAALETPPELQPEAGTEPEIQTPESYPDVEIEFEPASPSEPEAAPTVEEDAIEPGASDAEDDATAPAPPS